MILPDFNEYFDIDVEKGSMIWRKVPKNRMGLLGKEAGTPTNSRGKFYQVVHIDKKAYKRHKIIYYMANNIWPPMIDHINGDSLDDRIINLRSATYLINNRNRTIAKPGRDLPMGVRHTVSKRYQARISDEKKNIHLGTFDTIKEAETAYLAARKEYFNENC